MRLVVVSPDSGAYTLARVLHLETGDVGVPLGGRDAGVAEDLLHDADVYTLLDEERVDGDGMIRQAKACAPRMRK
ncbi:hypothetical protein Mth01_50170 [Sphaerimonospora thailandensis]|uniref:Uncharacterized protein n=1 Tax=Sphaerimonospora thailandensis TaxID=795644 RepID=A0A8J3RDG9_9ACTN|nr:hypothetical protein Mth01_50170 [Sphaerimonospora thailandensis]